LLERIPLALTMGEPGGIGAEIALKAWLLRFDAEFAPLDFSARPPIDVLCASSSSKLDVAQNTQNTQNTQNMQSTKSSQTTREYMVPPFYLIDDPARLIKLSHDLQLAVPIQIISAPEEAALCFAYALPVLPLPLPLTKPVRPGVADKEHGAAVIASITAAVQAVKAGRACALVTNPIHKASLYEAGFAYPGHTEFLAALDGAVDAPIMLLAGPQVKVVPLTVHLPLKEAIATLSSALLTHLIPRIAKAFSQDFGIKSPRLAVAGLNPHAGENGSLGREEIDIVIPALEALRAQGLSILGPLAPDAMFHKNARQAYDLAICLYHDQALIPLKTLDFEEAVNVTLGLNFIRTSPDHGTALDIAGQGKASPKSLIRALQLAKDLALCRKNTLPY
jgi:4-hydroxythreonine-4-phosphate dehydrogenase